MIKNTLGIELYDSTALLFHEHSIDTKVARLVEYVGAAHDSNSLSFSLQNRFLSAKIRISRVYSPYDLAIEMDDYFEPCTARAASDVSRRGLSSLGFRQFKASFCAYSIP